MLIDDFQGVVAKYLYDAFGNTISKSGLLADANVYRLSSKEWHQNSGLAYYLYRYYDPNLQRWPNRDPIGENGGLNLYAFVRNASPNSIDPLGRGTWTVTVENDQKVKAVNERPTITASYTLDAGEQKCCKLLEIKRKASGGLSSNDNDDPDPPLGFPTAVSVDQPGGSFGWDPSLIPTDFYFTWTAICMKGPNVGKTLSRTSHSYTLFLYTGTLDPPTPSPPVGRHYYPYPGAGPL